MKRLFALFTSALLLVGCGGEPSLQGRPSGDFSYTETSDEPYDFGSARIFDALHYRDGYIYLPLVSEGIESSYDYLRLNPKSGNVTSVCSDPLCLHETRECPFWGSQSALPIGGDRFIIRQYTIDGAELINRIMLYDAGSDKSSLLADYGMEGGGLESEVTVGDLRFYRDQVRDGESYRYPILRTDLSSQKTVEISDSETDTLLFAIGERLFLSDGHGIYSLAFDGTDRRDELENVPYDQISTDGEYVYYRSNGELFRRSLGGGEAEPLKIKLEIGSTYRLTENYIYYFAGESSVIGKAKLDGWVGDEVEISSPELRRCRHNGSDDELIYDFSEPSDGRYYTPQTWLAVGNYVYLTAAIWQDADSDGIFTDSEHSYTGSDDCILLRVDTTTHELLQWEVKS